MDIRCPICGEPWDFDCIHERVAELYPDASGYGDDGKYHQELYDKFYLSVKNDFYKRGCKALGYDHNEIHPHKNAALLSSMLMDIMGDDIDGIASELEDAEYMGLI